MRFELSTQHLKDVLLELQRMADQSLQISLIHEESPLVAGALRALHLVEKQGGARVNAFCDNLDAWKVRDHDQIAFQPPRNLVGKISERVLHHLLEAAGGRRPRRSRQLTIEMPRLQECKRCLRSTALALAQQAEVVEHIGCGRGMLGGSLDKEGSWLELIELEVGTADQKVVRARSPSS